jgi:DNA (cytosine-5)-methyltransferase 1
VSLSDSAPMKKPRVLDLFCCAGGASKGFHDAGFDVTGVDIVPRPSYPFRFVQGDALTVDLQGFDLIWASPKCQFATAYKRRPGHVRESANMIPDVRARLIAHGTPYILENVEGARAHLESPFTLCGSMFGLEVRRHRCFETSFPVLAPPCNHAAQRGDYPQATNRANRRRTVEVGVWRIPLEVQQKAMGIDWMGLEELSQAIPPAYSEFIARAFLANRAGAVQ